MDYLGRMCRKHIILLTIAAILSTVIITALILIGGFWLWFSKICTQEMTLVQLSSSLSAEIPSKPDADAKLYTLGRDRFLLVLTARSSKYPEGYYVNLFHGEVGLPDFPDYIPLFNFALVDRRIYDGFPELGALKASWDVKNKGKEIHLRITDFKIHEPGTDSERWMRERIPIAYRSEIIIRKK